MTQWVITPRDEIGRRARLKIWWMNNPCWFEPGRGDHLELNRFAVFCFYERSTVCVDYFMICLSQKGVYDET